MATNIDNGNGSVFMMIGTFFFYLLSAIALQQWASVAAIIAAVSTIVYNIQRIHKNRKNGANKDRPGSV